VPRDFIVTARSASGHVAAVRHAGKPHFGIQFHPEVSHTREGMRILDAFLTQCRCERDWSLEDYLRDTLDYVRSAVGDHPVIILASGGVDSTVACALLLRALPAEQVHALHIDNGLMRLKESEEVLAYLRDIGFVNLHFEEASREFLRALKEITDPEEKRRIIGDTFVEVQERAVRRLGLPEGETFLAQGTLYTDLIESGRNPSGTASVIKSHHNVNTPKILQKRFEGKIVEPNRLIFKDEVRKIGEMLRLPERLLLRHPFPGPGLAIRILGEVNGRNLEIVRHADHVFVDELRRHNLYEKIWQAFAVLLPVRSVGVKGDRRTYENVIVLRAIQSLDGMTADWFPMPHDVLQVVSSRITNEVRGVNRVAYDVSSKPPATIEWE
jgi:GMP synthase (glutamine-hydrolysing)